REYGVRDFVLCVGRIESRKNQLMLLKALEDSELTVVLAGGGFTYQPEYDQAVRRFVRKGRTIVLDKLSPEMLASAYCAAKVHCLPSWYELPGLVSLEAAHYGCNVVATRSGSTTDYLGDNAFYCDPWSEDSIKNAVLAGYFSPLNSDLKNIVSAFTWERSANEVLKVYREVAKPLAAAAHDSSTVTPSYVPFSAQSVVGSPVQLPFQNFDEVLQKGEEAAKNKDFIQAEQYLEQAEKLQPRSVRALRARGAVRLAQGDHIVAKSYFERALQIDAADPKTMSGLGMCLMMEKRPHDAYQYFVNALDQVPGHLVTVLQLVECSYMIERYDDLERFLRIFCASHPEDIEMLYCHAGSLYKLNRFEESHALVQKVLMRNPDHLGAKQLLDLVKEKLSGATSAPQGVANTHAASFSSNGLNSTLDTLANKYSNKWKPEQASAPTSFSNSVVSREGVLNQSAQSNIVEQVQIERTVPAAGNQAIEAELTSLEEQKRARKYGDVLDGLSTFQARQDINFAQREAAKLLEAECLVLTGQAERASTIYREVLGQNPRSARAICGEGALAASRSDWAGARNHFQQALSIQPQYDVALAGLGLCANWAKETEQAWNY
ncbi:MAG: glycosyltransferase, partial [Bdellovibrionales bacterium]|nr:glycosyltransferase [Bdellovibrionales bacterium]